MSVEPIKPEEVTQAKKEAMPDEVITAFNQLIMENWDGDRDRASVKQDDAVDRIIQLLDCTKLVVFNKNYLDVEGIFEDIGWNVKYDKPGYNETGDSFFIFTK